MGFSKGDRVAWNTAQGTTHGTVQSKHTEDLEFKGQTFRAEDDDPVYVVKSEKSGSEAAHKESALTATKGDSDDDGGSGKGGGSGKNSGRSSGKGGSGKDSGKKKDSGKSSGKSDSGKGDGEHHPTKRVQEAAQRAVKWIEEGKAGKGFTDTGEHRAHQLAEGETVDDEVVKKMRAYFKRHDVDHSAEGFDHGEDGYPSPGRVAWDAWGGDAGRKWAESQTIEGD